MDGSQMWNDTDGLQLIAITKAINAATDDARITEAEHDRLMREISDIDELLTQRKFGQAKQDKGHLLRYMKRMKFM